MNRNSIMNKILRIVLVCVVLFSFTTSAIVAAEQNYSDWEDVADAMAVHLNEAVEVYEQGGEDAAKKATESINIAYFRFYEKLGFEKITMSSISGERGSKVEHQFYKTKRHIKNGSSPEQLKEDIDELITMLQEDAKTLDDARNTSDGGSEQGSLIGGIDVFLKVLGLTLREGLEAILVVAAIIAYLTKTGNSDKKKPVYYGAILGILFSVFLAVLFNIIAQKVGDVASGVGQEVFEGIAMFVAVGVLFYVSNWMLSKSEVEVWNKYIQDKVDTSISKGSILTLGFAAFLAVAREGAELILFFQGMRSSMADNINYVWFGLVVAIIVLAIVYYAITKLSVRLPLKPFFIATSWLMFILCISFMGKGVYELQEVDVIGRTVIPWMHGFNFDLLGIYDRVETLLPQVILLIITIYSVILHNKNNKKRRAEIQK